MEKVHSEKIMSNQKLLRLDIFLKITKSKLLNILLNFIKVRYRIDSFSNVTWSNEADNQMGEFFLQVSF